MAATAAPRPQAAKSAPAPAKPAAESTEKKEQARFDIDEFRVEGADTIPLIEVEEAVYPFLGPDRSAEDVEKARAALEKAYHSKGFQTVIVAIPQQNPDRGFVVLKVTESKVGQLRVKGSRFFSLDKVNRGDLPDAVGRELHRQRRGPPPSKIFAGRTLSCEGCFHFGNGRQAIEIARTRFDVTVRFYLALVAISLRR